MNIEIEMECLFCKERTIVEGKPQCQYLIDRKCERDMRDMRAIRDDGYPYNWQDIARRIKEKAEWKCVECGHKHDIASGYVLTVHHINGIKSDCRDENLIALCQRCYLRVQGILIHTQHKQAQEKAGQGVLF